MAVFSHELKIHIDSLDALARFAVQLAKDLHPGDVVTLDGPLGAGKTTLVQKLGEALGLTEPVASPTFVLMHEYLSGRMPVVHVDLYRLGPENAASFAEELYAVMDEGRSLLLIEWACYGEFLADCLTVSVAIAPEGDNLEGRQITISSTRALLENLPAEFRA